MFEEISAIQLILYIAYFVYMVKQKTPNKGSLLDIVDFLESKSLITLYTF